MIKVMLVDDDDALCLTVKMVLEHAGSDVIGEGKTVWKRSRSSSPQTRLSLTGYRHAEDERNGRPHGNN